MGTNYKNLEWNDYRSVKPPIAGWYVWRASHKFIKGLVLIFLSRYRERSAGAKKTLSPEFDYWDGYGLLLPDGPIAWAEYDGEPPRSGCELLEVVGAKNIKCPFCKKVPDWKYSERYIGSGPINTDFFYLDCCRWVNGLGVREINPVTLSNRRNALLLDRGGA